MHEPEVPSPPRDGGFSHVDLDAVQVKVLAHPIRSRLLTALRRHGPATATALAQRLGSNTGTTSYHLRKLADVGLVADALEHGDGRDRWWRAAQDSHSYRVQRFADDPDAAAAADWLYAHYLRGYARLGEDWLEQRHEWPAAWQAASNLSDAKLHLSAEELEALVAELHDVVLRWRRDHADPGRPGTEQVILQLHAFPTRGGPS
ncbi:ArsR/SmtB family transcription factor [Euzebya sp.]|uniref:ArsR/SmtB family transcription factor n=1 Tax=Euzebya sp. TaxID=1971409 RepID=UPI003519CB3C